MHIFILNVNKGDRLANLVRQAFEISIQVLGERARRGLIEDLQRFDINMDKPDLALEELVRGLEKVLGYEAAE